MVFRRMIGNHAGRNAGDREQFIAGVGALALGQQIDDRGPCRHGIAARRARERPARKTRVAMSIRSIIERHSIVAFKRISSWMSLRFRNVRDEVLPPPAFAARAGE
jgi:hypothetical protein